jgi:hypothetical protein
VESLSETVLTIDELTETVVRLPLAERLALLEAISRSLRTDIVGGQRVGEPVPATDPLYAQIAVLVGAAVSPHGTIRHVLGIARRNKSALSDEEVRDVIADELIARHP